MVAKSTCMWVYFISYTYIHIYIHTNVYSMVYNLSILHEYLYPHHLPKAFYKLGKVIKGKCYILTSLYKFRPQNLMYLGTNMDSPSVSPLPVPK